MSKIAYLMQQRHDAPVDCPCEHRFRLQKVPIRLLLTVPGLLPIIVVVALTGWLSWWHGKQTITRFAFQLESEIGDRIQLKIDTYLAAPQLVAQFNQNLVTSGQLKLNDWSAVERQLFTQLTEFKSVSGILIGTETEHLRAVNRRQGLHLLKRDPEDQGQIQTYVLNQAGEKIRRQGTIVKPSVRQFPWYEAAMQAKQPVWSPVFQTPDNRDLSLNLNVPLYAPQSNQAVGVASAGVVLSVIDRFLDQIQVSQSGLVFIVERNGNLIGSSTPTASYSGQQTGKPQLRQIAAVASSDRLISQTAQQLQTRYGQWTNMSDRQQITLSQSGQRQFVRVVPYRNQLGLDWLIVVVIPETDFTDHLERNLYNTIWLCLIAAAIAFTLGKLAADCVAKPMLQLSQVSQAIADGDLDRRLPENGLIREMQVTAQAFNQMAAKLGLSFKQIEAANQNLEAQVQRHTAQLWQALQFEDLLRRITEKVRDSLNEAQILQTAVRELALGLGVQGCNVALYDLETRTSTIYYEYLCADLPSAQGQSILMADWLLYPYLLQRQSLHFCLTPSTQAVYGNQKVACLACPIMDDQGVLGDLWLFGSQHDYFSEQEIRLVQQVANQCAIALRQSHLYQTAQLQVQELEQLHHVKDDFLSTVSHELRTPMANIKMAMQLLEMSLEQIPGSLPASVYRYLQILKDEGERELTLINDLLDLSRLEAGTEPYLPTTIDPKVWIPHVVEPFIERAQTQNQQLQLDLPAELPPLTTDLADLERILTELLNNACKYTPAGEQIVVSAVVTVPESDRVVTAAAGESIAATRMPTLTTSPQATALATTFCLKVTNSGNPIPEPEHDRIFDKFYRIPSNDPWKHGGTGLGLALVKGLVEKLAGKIDVENSAGATTFTVQLPIERSKI